MKALGNHGYAVDMKVETQKGDTVDGVFHRPYVVDFDASGARREDVAPDATNTLGRLKLADKDIGLLGDPMSLALTADSFADRDIVYSRREKYSEHNLALFDALPDYPIGDMRFEVLARAGHRRELLSGDDPRRRGDTDRRRPGACPADGEVLRLHAQALS